MLDIHKLSLPYYGPSIACFVNTTRPNVYCKMWIQYLRTHPIFRHPWAYPSIRIGTHWGSLQCVWIWTSMRSFSVVAIFLILKWDVFLFFLSMYKFYVTFSLYNIVFCQWVPEMSTWCGAFEATWQEDGGLYWLVLIKLQLRHHCHA